MQISDGCKTVIRGKLTQPIQKPHCASILLLINHLKLQPNGCTPLTFDLQSRRLVRLLRQELQVLKTLTRRAAGEKSAYFNDLLFVFGC